MTIIMLFNKKRNFKHGAAKTAEYRIWKIAKNRGLLCTSWNSFQNFLRGVGSRPSVSHRLLRINHKKKFQPGNFRWVEKEKRSSKKEVKTYRGMTLSLACKKFGIKEDVVRQRLHRGWPMKRALTERVRVRISGGHD